MVNNINVSAYIGTPPTPCSCTANCQCRVIRSTAPLYAKEQVVPLLDAVSLNLWTKQSKRDVEHSLNMSLDELAECIKNAVISNCYKKSEWCRQSTTNDLWAACDVYTYVHKYWSENAYKWLPLDCYFKFAISKTGQMILIASCHSST